MPAVPILRVARPTDNLAALLRFYCDGLGLQVLKFFTAHNGFDGVMLGHPQSPYHLEFTHQPGHTVGRAPTADHLLIFYLPDAGEWQAAGWRIEEVGFAPVPPTIPTGTSWAARLKTPTATVWCSNTRLGRRKAYLMTKPTLRPRVGERPECA